MNERNGPELLDFEREKKLESAKELSTVSDMRKKVLLILGFARWRISVHS